MLWSGAWLHKPTLLYAKYTFAPSFLPNTFVFPQENADQHVLPGLQGMYCRSQASHDLFQCPSPKESYTSLDPSQP